jgi:hypothetical protein
MIFLVSGIFWGQCMEICGRFHHWMPIIVFFIKRDLFFYDVRILCIYPQLITLLIWVIGSYVTL